MKLGNCFVISWKTKLKDAKKFFSVMIVVLPLKSDNQCGSNENINMTVMNFLMTNTTVT